MDRNQATGLVMIALLFIVYFTFFAPDPPEATDIPEQTETQSPAAQQSTPSLRPTEPVYENDSVKQATLSQQYGLFAPGFSGESEKVLLENEHLQIKFDSKGARIKSVLLKDFLTYDKEPLYLITEEDNQIDLIVNTANGPLNLNDLYYEPSLGSVELEEGNAKQLSFRIDLGNGRSITQTYILPADGYQVQYRVKTSGLNSAFTDNALTYRWNNIMRNFEHDLNDSRGRSTVNYYTIEEDYEELDKTDEEETVEVEESVKWVGMNHRFFTAAVISDDYFGGARLSTTIPANDTTVLRTAGIQLSITNQSLESENGVGMRYYFGPNNQRILAKVADGFERNVQLGYFVLRPINKWLVIPTFHFLEKFFTNYGIIILLLVLFIKLLLFPLSYKSYISMAKTRVLKPQLDEIKAKHGDDMAAVQQEQMKLYSQLGINPISGCIPMVLQMPILFSLFYFFPNSIELRQESFLWANDLSTYDSILTLPFTIPAYGNHVSLFCLLMAGSQILMTMNNQQMSTVQGPMKTISYIMPVTFLFFLNSFPAGLTYYYFLTNIITFGQQAIIGKFVDDEKVKSIIEKNRLKNKDKKTSGFQARLQEALKASQEAKKSQEPSRKPSKPKKK